MKRSANRRPSGSGHCKQRQRVLLAVLVCRCIRSFLQTLSVLIDICVMASRHGRSRGAVDCRPLTHVSTHLSDQEARSPNHFILGRARSNLPPDIFVDKEISSRRRWRRAQVVTNHVWKRWLKEYIPNLLERRKWTANARNLEKGHLVLIVDPGSPRGIYPNN